MYFKVIFNGFGFLVFWIILNPLYEFLQFYFLFCEESEKVESKL